MPKITHFSCILLLSSRGSLRVFNIGCGCNRFSLIFGIFEPKFTTLNLRLFLIMIFWIVQGFTQGTLSLKVGKEFFTLHRKYPTPSGDSLKVDQFKFYLGDISGNYHLVDLEDTATMRLPFWGEAWAIGMDSAANTSGNLDGAFDPLLGMYWAWNTGYIQLKVVGTFFHEQQWNPFEYHIGGYRAPYLTHQKIQRKHLQHVIELHLDPLFAALPLKKHPKIMLPGAEALRIHQAFAACFE